MRSNTNRKNLPTLASDIFFIAATILAGLLLVTTAAATPPSAMSISYDGTSQELGVTITHTTTNPGIHYIREVKVNVNGQTVNDSAYTSQPTADTFTYVYPLHPKAGDTVEVTATCSLAGSSTKSLIVQEATTVTVPGRTAFPSTTQKAATGLVPVTGHFVGIFAKKLGLFRFGDPGSE
jgi:hypothetical protein